MSNSRRLLAAVIAAISLLLATKAVAACDNQTPIRVALFDFAPFYFPVLDGQPHGLLIDELQSVMDQLGCQWQATFYPAPVMMERMVTGGADLTMLIDHPMLAGRARLSRNPILQIHVASYQNHDSPAIQRFDQLRQQRVITIRGYSYGGLFERLIDPAMQVELHMAADIASALKMLTDNHGDYLLSYQRPTDAVLAKLDHLDIRSTRMQSNNVYFVVSPNYQDRSLLERLDRVLQSRQQARVTPETANVTPITP